MVDKNSMEKFDSFFSCNQILFFSIFIFENFQLQQILHFSIKSTKILENQEFQSNPSILPLNVFNVGRQENDLDLILDDYRKLPLSATGVTLKKPDETLLVIAQRVF